MTDEDLYFWGMYKNKDNKILICPKCGSKNILKVTAQEPVFIEVSIPYKCKDCGYQGKPKLIDLKQKKFENKSK